MEKIPNLRVIGGVSEEEKEKVAQEMSDKLYRHVETLPEKVQEKIKSFELKKTAEEIAFIDFANEETNRLMQEVGIEPYDVPYENVHVIPDEEFKKESDTKGGLAFQMNQAILIHEENRKFGPSEGLTIFHEMMHIKAHLTIEVQKENDELIKNLYRSGMDVGSSVKDNSRGGHHWHFLGLNEAIVATQEKKSFEALLNIPEMSEYKKLLKTEKYKTEFLQEVARHAGVPVDEVEFANEEDYKTFSYRKQREVLDYVMEEVQAEFPEKYKSKDDVFKEFLKSHFTGRLLPIARLVESVFGRGSFRELGNMGARDGEEGNSVLIMESLKKFRLRKQNNDK